ncbi:uncharacterized protein METZ01_LOCUS237987 [marine metagenome]|uniref:Uncharacterized protein n=1 Tax=marine metagenome TaxID=408172 RepID=A0A382HEH2_9ZZZZ
MELIYCHARILNQNDLNLYMTLERLIIVTALIIQVLFGQNSTQLNVNGIAYYKSGVLLENAETILMDTTEKVISRTTTDKKFLKKFGGGKFSFSNLIPGHYKIRIVTGEDININHRFELKNESIDLGSLYPFKEFPKYSLTKYKPSSKFKMRRIPTSPIPSDSINIRHVIVDLDGNANTVIVDSIIIDSVYYTDAKTLERGMLLKEKVYFIYNDYGVFIHQSRSLKNRIEELQRRDGYVIFQSEDTLSYNNIFFEPEMNNPEVATFHFSDTTGKAVYHSLFDIYKVRSGPSYLGNSVKKGFYLGLISVLSGDYGTIITVVPIVTLGKVGYDWYKDKRSNYFLPKNENTPFPKNMFVFSFTEWFWKKSQPIISPIVNSRPVKWWTSRKLRKIQKQAAKRKSASD